MRIPYRQIGEKMRTQAIWFIFGFLVFGAGVSQAQTNGMLRNRRPDSVDSRYVVYGGYRADDYLPESKTAARRPGPVRRKPHGHPAVSLPDTFYVVAVPVFLGTFIYVIALIIRDMPDTTDTH